jgi:hypothetical protein
MKDSPNYFKLGPDRIKAKEKDTESTFSEKDTTLMYSSAMNYGSPMNKPDTGDEKRLSGSERKNLQEGINVKSPKIQALYEEYKKSGGKLTINAAARIGFASPEESRRRMEQANIPGSRGRDALKGV